MRVIAKNDLIHVHGGEANSVAAHNIYELMRKSGGANSVFVTFLFTFMACKNLSWEDFLSSYDLALSWKKEIDSMGPMVEQSNS